MKETTTAEARMRKPHIWKLTRTLKSHKIMLPEIRYMEEGTPVVKPVPSISHLAIGFKSDWP